MLLYAAAMCAAADAGLALKTGAERTDEYLPRLEGLRVALFSNHTGMVGDRHTLDVMLDG